MSSDFPKHVKLGFLGSNSITGLESDGTPIYTVEYQLLFFLSNLLNFTYTIVTPREGILEVGRRLNGTNWTGMYGMLQRGEIDASFQIREIHHSAPFDFSFPIRFDRITFATQKPRPIQKNMALLHPFPVSVWILFVFSAFVFFLLFCVMNVRGRRWAKTFFSTLGNLLGQPFSVPLVTRSHVILFVGWIITISFLIHAFKATLLSSLLAIPKKGISTIDELASDVLEGSVKCRTFHKDPMIEKLQGSTDASVKIVAKSVYENSQESRIPYMYLNPDSTQRGAFIAMELHLFPIKNFMFISEDSFFPVIFAFPLGKKFRGKRLLDKIIMRMFETGLIEKMYNDIIFKKMLSSFWIPPSADGIKRITLEDFEDTFVIFGIGLSLAFLVFLAEILLRLRC